MVGQRRPYAISASYLGLIERAALSASGAAVFLPAAWLLAVSPSAAAGDWLAWGIALAVWVVGFVPAFARRRPEIQLIAGFVLLSMAWFLPGPSEWIQPSIAGFGVVVGAVFTLRAFPALMVVLAATVIGVIDANLQLPSVAFVAGPMPQRLLGPALVLVAGTGLVVTVREWRRTVMDLEGYEASVRALIDREHRAEQARLAREAMLRRMHETVLNTLTGLSYGIPASAVPEARARAASGVEGLERSWAFDTDTNVTQVVRVAIAAVPTVAVSVQVDGDAVVDAVTAEALRDAVVEALRNVDRHAGVRHASVTGRVSRPSRTLPEGSIALEVRDEGVGFDLEDVGRFGMHRSLRAGVEAVRGRVDVVTTPGAGTRVCIDLPVARPFPPAAHAVRSLSMQPVLVRVGLLATNLYLVACLPVLVAGWPSSTQVAIAVLAFAALNTALALRWESSWHVGMVAAGALLALLVAAAARPAAQAVDSPGAMEQLGWLMLALGGGGSILLVQAVRGARRVALVAVTVLAALAWLTLSVPPQWRLFPAMATVVAVIYLIAAAVSVAFADGLLERRRFEAMSGWDALARTSAVREARELVAGQREAVDPAVRSFLIEVAEGHLDPSSDAVRVGAAHLADRLRGALAGAPEPSPAFAGLVSALEEHAVKCGVDVESAVAGHLVREDAYPAAMVQRLVAAATMGRSARITALAEGDHEEIVLRVDGIDTSADTPVASAAADCSISFDRDETEPRPSRVFSLR